ncbi:MAG: winged helix DNA-binding domain-containing protein [Bacteroidales bacterium]|nr:winged helix DNA-binding domain-containing protein [Bacteroidales bacterium]
MKTHLPTITDIRLQSHQLAGTTLQTPRELLAWMGAMQAQDFNMAKWAIGVRLRNMKEPDVMAAYSRGEILRTHVLRPTWHFVAPENIRWMLALSAERIKSSSRSRDRELDISEKLYDACNDLIRKVLQGRQLTRNELGQELEKAGIMVNSARLVHFMMRAEVEGVVCSGAPAGKEQTYALLDERAPRMPVISKEEALAKLARIYFTSHCPATLADFVWWSGLSMTEARQGMDAVKNDFVAETIGDKTYLIANTFKNSAIQKPSACLLPAFDEYLISYTDRSAALASENHSKAVSSNGVFRPIIVVDGKVAGLWKKTQNKKQPVVFNFFASQPVPSADSMNKAVEAIVAFRT